MTTAAPRSTRSVNAAARLVSRASTTTWCPSSRRVVAAARPSPWAEPVIRMRVTRVLSFAWLAEVAVDGGIVYVDALVGELAVDESEDRPGVDLDLSVVMEAPDAGDLEDDHVVVFLPDVD